MIDGGEAAWGAARVPWSASRRQNPPAPGGCRRGTALEFRLARRSASTSSSRRLGKTVLRLAPFLLALLAVPVGAQVATDRVTGGADKRAAAAATARRPGRGRGEPRALRGAPRGRDRRSPGTTLTKDRVITREILTRAGEPFHVTAMADVQRLDNLSIFAQIGVAAEADGEGVRLTFRFKEMPAWIPLAGFSYTEEDGFSGGPKLSALNLAGRGISLGVRAYFGGAKQYSSESFLAVDRRRPRVVQFPWSAAEPHRHPERVQGNELRVHARGRAIPRGTRPSQGQVLAVPPWRATSMARRSRPTTTTPCRVWAPPWVGTRATPGGSPVRAGRTSWSCGAREATAISGP